MFQDTEPTSSVFSIGTESNVNTSTASHLAYFWHSVAGFSKFGIYTGNGDADGPFLFTGFRPRLLYIKKVDAVNNWRVRNTASSTSNTITKILWWDLDFAETSNSAYSFDVHSHGFKIRTGNSDFNGSTNTYIYGAWGDTPLKYGNTF